jgi:Zn-finger nucleic acid-binding protein
LDTIITGVRNTIPTPYSNDNHTGDYIMRQMKNMKKRAKKKTMKKKKNMRKVKGMK